MLLRTLVLNISLVRKVQESKNKSPDTRNSLLSKNTKYARFQAIIELYSIEQGSFMQSRGGVLLRSAGSLDYSHTCTTSPAAIVAAAVAATATARITVMVEMNEEKGKS